ncbi:mutagen-sensitive 101 [Brevipalpus obovatus]|uniref:mutagen-sensitive 101 n=1 Tax=Brevipalpus obovatus TaxID=246614 RepID=UPI003D9E3B95
MSPITDRQTSSTPSYEIFFLQTSDHCSSRLTDTRTALTRPAFKLINIRERDIDRIIRDSPLPPLIVVDLFEGDVFQRIKDRKGIRIVSALLLIELNPTSYFKIPSCSYPIESMSMYGLNIYLSGYPKHSEERRALKKRVKRMGGVLSDSVKPITSHIVIKSWETKTAKEARKNPEIIRDKPLMSPDWIDYCYDNRNRNIGNAARDELMARFQMKLFEKFLFSTTGFNETERTEIQKNVLKYGGLFNSSLILPRPGDQPTTHLIAKVPHGLKYNKALLESPETHIVELAWFKDSINRGRTIPFLESVYSLRPSQEIEELPRPTTTRIDRVSSVSMTPKTPRASNSRPVSALDESFRKLEELIAEKQKHDHLFEGCSFCFIDLERKGVDSARKIIRMYGGSVYNELTSVVTHLLIGPDLVKHPDKLKSIFKAEERFHSFAKVNLDWVIDSVNAGQMLPERLDEAIEELFRSPRAPFSQEPNFDRLYEYARAVSTPKIPRLGSTAPPVPPPAISPQEQRIHHHELDNSYNPHTSIRWES